MGREKLYWRSKILLGRLSGALAWHGRAYPNGDWKGANDAIGRVIKLADVVILQGGEWPTNKRFLCNADRQTALSNLVVKR